MATIQLGEDIHGGRAARRPLAGRDFHGVVFDMDGLLLDTERIYQKTLLCVVQETGHPFGDAGVARMIGYPEDICKKILAEELGTAEPVDAIFTAVNERYHERITTEPIPMRPGALELIALLQQHGIPLALATSTYRAPTDTKLRNAGLADAFAVTVCGDEVTRGKPFPEPYLKAVRELKLDPAQTFALEDSPTGLKAAHDAGLYTILVPDLVAPDAASLAMADAVVLSLREVCRSIRRS